MRKKTRKILSIAVAVALTFSLSLNASADIYIDYDSTETVGVNSFAEFDLSQHPEIAAEMKKQEKAIAAYQKIIKQFERDENNCYIYPDAYAGEYIDEDGNLIVLYTEITSELEFLQEIENITLRKVEKSINELEENLVASKTALANNSDYEISTSGIDVETNSAFIEVLPKNETSAMRTLLLDNVINVNSNVIINITNENPVTQSVEIVGGSPIDNYATKVSNDDWLTVAANGWYNGQQAILTCGHSATLDRDVYYNNSYIGTVAYSQFDNNEYGDYSFIPVTSSVANSSRLKTSSSSTATISDTYTVIDDVPLNTICYKFGSVSNQRSTIKITKRNIDVSYSAENKTIKGLFAGELISGTSLGGDSGGPYYLINSDGTVTFIGIHSGYSSSANEVYFTPYYMIAGGFGVTTA